MLGVRKGTLALALSLVACTPTGERGSSQQSVVQRSTVDGFVEATLPNSWALSVAASGTTPLRPGLGVALQPEGLFLGDQRLVAAEAGWLERSAIEEHLVVPLADRMSSIAPLLNEDPEARHANLYLHPDTRVGDLVDILYTLGRHEIASHQLAVAPSEGQLVTQGLEFSLPTFLGPGKDTWLVIELARESVIVGYRTDGRSKPPDLVLSWDEQPMLALRLIIDEFIGRTQATDTIVFLAAPELRVELLVEAMAAAGHGARRILEAGPGS